MATWQFDISAVSRERGQSLPPAYRERIQSFLDGILDAEPVMDGWVRYGEQDGNRFDLNWDDDGCELSLRIDARTEADSFLALICVLMADLDCTLYSPELSEWVSSDIGSLRAALQRSAAWRYALDPQRFLNSIRH